MNDPLTVFELLCFLVVFQAAVFAITGATHVVRPGRLRAVGGVEVVLAVALIAALLRGDGAPLAAVEASVAVYATVLVAYVARLFVRASCGVVRMSSVGRSRQCRVVPSRRSRARRGRDRIGSRARRRVQRRAHGAGRVDRRARCRERIHRPRRGGCARVHHSSRRARDMPFIAAILIVVSVLLALLMVTCAHLLARVMRLEAGEQRRTEPAPRHGAAPLRTGMPLPVAASDAMRNVRGRTVAFHVVSTGCANCATVIERWCRAASVNGTEHRIVVAHDADRLLLPDECAVAIVTSPSLIDAVRAAGFALPVTVRVEHGIVIAVEADASHRLGRRDV